MRFVTPVPAGEEPPSAKEAPASTLDIASILKHCFSHPRLIVAAVVATTALGLGFSKLAHPTYVATTQILVDPSNLSLVQNDIAPTVQQGDAGVSAVESQVRIMTSGNVLRRVVKTLGLADDDAYLHGSSLTPRFLANLFKHAPKAGGDPALGALAILEKNITVRRPERTYIIELSVKDVDPERAALIANAIPQAYLEERTAAAAETARRASASLGARLDELRDKVQIADTKLAKFREDNNLIGANGRPISDQELGDLITQLDQAKGRTRLAIVRLHQIQTAANGPLKRNLPEVAESPEVQALRTQLNALGRTEADLSGQFGALHPALVSIRAQIQATRQQLEREADRAIDTARQEITRSIADEEALKKQLIGLKQQLAKDAQATVEQRQLEREAEAQRAIYESFLRRSHEAGEQADIDKNNARVITQANPPAKPTWPPSPTIILLGSAFIGLLLGISGSFLLDMRSQSGAANATPRNEQAAAGQETNEGKNETKGGDKNEDKAPQRSPFEIDFFPAPQNIAHQKKRLPHNSPRRIYIFSDLTRLPLDVLAAPNSNFARTIRLLFNDLYDEGRSARIVLAIDIDRTFGAATLAANFALVASSSSLGALLVEADPERRLLDGLGGDLPEKRPFSPGALVFHRKDEKIGVALAELPRSFAADERCDSVFERALQRYDVIVVHAGDASSPHIPLLIQLCDEIVLVGSTQTLDGSQDKNEKLATIVADRFPDAQDRIAAIVAVDVAPDVPARLKAGA